MIFNVLKLALIQFLSNKFSIFYVKKLIDIIIKMSFNIIIINIIFSRIVLI